MVSFVLRQKFVHNVFVLKLEQGTKHNRRGHTTMTQPDKGAGINVQLARNRVRGEIIHTREVEHVSNCAFATQLCGETMQWIYVVKGQCRKRNEVHPTARPKGCAFA
jgi:hypothetical protein